jgi:hypothetical protein
MKEVTISFKHHEEQGLVCVHLSLLKSESKKILENVVSCRSGYCLPTNPVSPHKISLFRGDVDIAPPIIFKADLEWVKRQVTACLYKPINLKVPNQFIEGSIEDGGVHCMCDRAVNPYKVVTVERVGLGGV